MATYSPMSVYADTARHKLGDWGLAAFIVAAARWGLVVEAIKEHRALPWSVQINGKRLRTSARSLVLPGDKWNAPTYRLDTQKVDSTDVYVMHDQQEADSLVWISNDTVNELIDYSARSSHDDPERIHQINDQWEIPAHHLTHGWDTLKEYLLADRDDAHDRVIALLSRVTPPPPKVPTMEQAALVEGVTAPAQRPRRSSPATPRQPGKRRLKGLTARVAQRLKVVPVDLACPYPQHRAYGLDYCLIPHRGRGRRIELCGVCHPDPWRGTDRPPDGGAA